MSRPEVPTDYLRGSLIDGHQLAAGVLAATQTVAEAWLARGIKPGPLEVTSELLARIASELGEASVSWGDLEPALASLQLPPEVLRWLEVALEEARSATQLAALAVHLVDVAESLALATFVPELPRLAAKSDRTGDAARNVGVARHLRG